MTETEYSEKIKEIIEKIKFNRENYSTRIMEAFEKYRNDELSWILDQIANDLHISMENLKKEHGFVLFYKSYIALYKSMGIL